MDDIGKSTSELPSHLTQYIAALSVSLGGFSFSTSLAYTSSASHQLMNNSTNSSLVITTDQNNWFSSTINLGGIIGGLLGGVCVNTLGRRGAMLASVLPFVGAWVFISFAQNFAMLMCGRFISGVCAGVTCIAVPTYIGEISSPDIRGTLGMGLPVMVAFGIEYSYIFGAIMTSWRSLALVSAIPPVIYFILVFFTKESPTYLLSKGKEEEAKEALQYFRGKHYDVEPEMNVMRQTQEEARQNTVSMDELKKPYIVKPLVISCILMVLQQLSGAIPVLFNMSLIFKVRLCLFPPPAALDVFFYQKFLDEDRAIENLSWLPLICLIVFVTAFAIGLSPVPWVMTGELFSLNVRGPANGVASMVNWTMSFVVSLAFQPLQAAIGPYGIFWFFAACCAISIIFCILVVPETKGKTLQEITRQLGGPDTTEVTLKKQEEISRF
ncbi:facilitated trehalose transporter Tret1-2 homolog [Homarus americanus]|uniref:facilitated trehalose transporter Tret1-2 homolog n=1 Tax=Homarus americanus TaxID=6706 RepID=UPI001C47B68B|nr:facilitated trehalose transporter Tret1-2 homolog [Homarus americanus]